MTKQAERRRYKRVPVRIPVRIFVKGHPEAIPAEVRDISEGGAFVQCDEELPSGDHVLLELQFADMEMVHGLVKPVKYRTGEKGQESSVIRWIREFNEQRGFGVQFVELRPEVRKLIREIVEHLSSNEPEF